MMMALTDEAREIVLHFVAHMPPSVRARYETTVTEMLKRANVPNENICISRCEDDEATQATVACVTVWHVLWSEARANNERDNVTIMRGIGGP